MVCNYTQLEGKEKESILTAPDGYQLNNFFKENYKKKFRSCFVAALTLQHCVADSNLSKVVHVEKKVKQPKISL